MFFKYLVFGILGLGVVAGGIFLFSKKENPPTGAEIVLVQYTPQTLEEYRGKPVVANSWAAWCPFCVKELADFAAVQKEFGDDVVILAINRAESPAHLQTYLQEIGIADDLVFLLDPADSFYRETLQGFSMPETIFLDKEGNVRFHKRGPMDKTEIRERIQEIL